MVAEVMHNHHLATLLFDLLTPPEAIAEETTGELRFNIPFLRSRLISSIRWALQNKTINKLGIGLFGASTGAAAALCAAAEIPEIQAVFAPTLLIVGEKDKPVMAWNEETLLRLPGIKHLVRIADATHLFQETGALEEVASTASAWFGHYLSPNE